MLNSLWGNRKNDPVAPPLSDLYALVEFDGFDEGQLPVAKGSLLELSRIKDQLTPEALELIHDVPEEDGTFMVVVDHPDGLGVMRLTDKDATMVSATANFEVTPNLIPIDKALQGANEITTNVMTGLGGAVELVDDLCLKHIAATGTLPTSDHAVAMCLDAQGKLHGAVITREEMTTIGTPEIQSVLKKFLDASPPTGRNLVVVLAAKVGTTGFNVNLNDVEHRLAGTLN